MVTPALKYGGNLAHARELFQLGWDTQRIAIYFGITEPQAVRVLDFERSHANGLPLPEYEAVQ